MTEPCGDTPPSHSATEASTIIEEISLAAVLLDAGFQDKQTLGQLLTKGERLQALLSESAHAAAQPIIGELVTLCQEAILDEVQDGAAALSRLGQVIDTLCDLIGEASPAEAAVPPAEPQRADPAVPEDEVAWFDLGGETEASPDLEASSGPDGPSPSLADDPPGATSAASLSEPTAAPASSDNEPVKEAPPPAPRSTPLERSTPEDVLETPQAYTLQSQDDMALLQEYLNESREHLDHIEQKILSLESQPGNLELVNELFRAFHSIKGASGFLGFRAINRLCHQTETLLDQVRKGKLAISARLVSPLLEAVDYCSRGLQALTELASAADGRFPFTAEIPPLRASRTVQQMELVLQGEAPPEAPPSQVQADRLGTMLLSTGQITPAQLSEALSQQGRVIGEILVDMGAVQHDVVESLAAQQRQRVAAPIKVDAEKLDSLMESVGELVIGYEMVARDPHLAGDANLEIAKKVTNLGKITRTIHHQVMRARLIPLRHTLQKMTRIVRDTAQKTGKQVRLSLSGEETEIDKTLTDELADPLMHVLRNAVDHGIEAPAERLALGKPVEGLIQLSARNKGGKIFVEVTDDGKGINKARLLERALELGLAKPAVSYSEQEITRFMLLPGFSTNRQATEISGRGVGLDVVAKSIERLGGTLEISSREGVGSTFTLCLPLSMAIVDGMLVKVRNERYVIPTVSILTTMTRCSLPLSSVAGTTILANVRGWLIPLVSLSDLFHLEGLPGEDEEGLIILIESDERRCGLLVDDVLGQHQVVVKDVGRCFRGLRGISGASIMSDGRVGLILDPAGLMELANVHTTRSSFSGSLSLSGGNGRTEAPLSDRAPRHVGRPAAHSG
ncbi:MAG: chemotaxis protein CheW [Candidatus Tectomicrobia bacterium]|nr:chemotaxis protein CheW [Candidatus Tectomicrobia bacterium]